MKSGFRQTARKKYARAWAFAGVLFTVVAVGAFAAIRDFNHPGVTYAQPLSAAQATMPVPQFGVNVGDYSNCMNGYAPDNSLGDTASGLWTPIDGGMENGVAGSGYAGEGFGAGDCIQAGMVANASNTYTEDFRIGIRVAPGLAGGSEGHDSSDSTVNTQCNWPGGASDWQFTPWASEGGGTSQFSVAPPNDTWGLECVQIEVQTSTLPAGEYVKAPSFGIAISHNGEPGHNDNTSVTSEVSATCYLDDPRTSWDRNPPQPSCPLLNIENGGNFWSAQVSLNVNSLNAVPTGSNIPSSAAVSATLTQGSDGQPLGITMKNTGSIAWASYFTPREAAGSSQGICNYDYDGQGIDDAPASGSGKGSSCSTEVSLTSGMYSLVHEPSSFSASPETVPLSYQNVTQTISYTPSSTVTILEPCPSGAKGALPFNDRGGIFSSFVHVAYAAAPGGTGGQCPTIAHIPEEWDVSYSGGGFSPSIAEGSSFTFPIASLTAPATAGTYTEQWQMAQDGVPFGVPYTAVIAVGGAQESATGTVTVQSLNDATWGPVSSTWQLIGTNPAIPNEDVCAYTNVPCSGTTQTYPNLPAGNAAINQYTVVPTDGSAGPQFALREIESRSLAAAPTPSFSLLGLERNLLVGVANAQTVCSYIDNSGSASSLCSANSPYTDVPEFGLAHAGDMGNFVILWTPVPAMTVSPTSTSLAEPGGATSAAITVTNSGAPGSSLAWTANITYGGVPSGWLTPETGGGTLTNSPSQSGTSGASTTFMFALATSSQSLATGTYTADVQFVGTSPQCTSLGKNICSSQDVAVALTVGGGGSGCAGSSCPCPGPTCDEAPSISIAPASSEIALGAAQTFSITSENVTSCTGSGDWSGPQPCNGPATVVPSSPGTYTYTVTTTNAAGTAKASAVVTVTTQKSGSPSCSLSANPASLVIPGSSTLSYSCTNVDVNRCTFSGGIFGDAAPLSGFSGTGVEGTVSVAPTTDTSYSIACYGTGGYAQTMASADATVTVTNPSLRETNP